MALVITALDFDQFSVYIAGTSLFSNDHIYHTQPVATLLLSGIGMSGFCAHRIAHPAQNLGSCLELRKIYQMVQKMRKFW